MLLLLVEFQVQLSIWSIWSSERRWKSNRNNPPLRLAARIALGDYHTSIIGWFTGGVEAKSGVRESDRRIDTRFDTPVRVEGIRQRTVNQANGGSNSCFANGQTLGVESASQCMTTKGE